MITHNRKAGCGSFQSNQMVLIQSFLRFTAAMAGLAAAVWMETLLLYALGFAGGAMIFVVVEEVILESQRGGNTDFATAGAVIGFLFMMILDVSLG